MSRILLADDSPHAQRMGERILLEEGFEVVTVTDGETALIRLADADPDLIMADVFLPLRSGYDICRYIKNHPRHWHARVVLLAGLLEPIDDALAAEVQADAILKKPFEASVVMDTIRPLIEAAQFARGLFGDPVPAASVTVETLPSPVAFATSGAATAAVAVAAPAKVSPELDPERIRAAITLALDASLPAMIEEITERVMVALGH